MTALMHAAATNQNPVVVSDLLDAGADPHGKSSDGLTAFDYAQRNKMLKGTPMYWDLNDSQY
jgi:ankyrin repeat protein